MTSESEKTLVLGVGNILLKDEGVGVRVIEELQRRYDFPEHVEVVDGGTQGLWLISTIQQADHLIVIDAVTAGGEPGTLYRLERNDIPRTLRVKQSAHDSDLVEALNLCALVEREPKTLVVIGVEPEDMEPYGLELTHSVAAKLDDMIDRVLDELKSLGIEPEKKI